MKVCPFNATHVVPTSGFQAHILECENRDTVEREMYRRSEANRLVPSKQSHSVQINNKTDEDWDSEIVQSYNPKEAIFFKEIPRTVPPGLGRAARQNWRIKEQERLERLKKGLPIHDLLISETGEDFSKDNCAVNGAVQEINKSNKICIRSLNDDTGKAAVNSHEVMRADRPLRHLDVAKPHTRIAANIFNNMKGDIASSCIQENASFVQSPETEECSSVYMKRKRKFQKKLVEIHKLEKDRENGCELNQEEQEKLAKKQYFEAELAKVLKDLSL